MESTDYNQHKKRKYELFKIIILSIFFVIEILFFIIFFIFFWQSFTKNKGNPFLIGEIKKEILNNIPTWKEEQIGEIKIEKEIDLYQDQEKELLVRLADWGGAAVDVYLLFQIKNNKLKLIKTKTEDNKINTMFLSQGSGGAGRYGFDFQILPEQGIVYQANYYAYNSTGDSCSAVAYFFDKENGLLIYDKNLSKKYQKEYCTEICKNVTNELKEYFVKICGNNQ